jgi:deoxyribonuclease-4
LGSNRDRHADIGRGELGEPGCSAFLSEPRFEDLPVLLETPGLKKEGPSKEQLELCHTLRRRGQGNRARAATRARKATR